MNKAAYNGIETRFVIVMKSFQLTTAVTALANVIACSLTIEEIALIAGIFVQLGDTLSTIAAQKSLCPEKDIR